MGRATVFAYVEQSRALRDMLRPLIQGPLDVVQVDRSGFTLQGHTCGIFVNITDHPHQPPREVWERVYAMGFIIWTIDESHARGRMQRLMDEHHADARRRHDGHGHSL